jgi:hypothetical protein
MGNWLFQGNPKRSPVLDRLLDGQSDISWCMTQHVGDVSLHDHAVLWVSGARAGVYAIGYVTGPPQQDVAGEERLDRGKPGYFCPLRWTEIRVERPILKTDLLASVGFEQARIIRQPMAGTPMKLTDGEWRLIERLG